METLREVAKIIEQPLPINELEWEKLVNVSTHVGKMVRKAFVQARAKKPTMYNGQVVSVSIAQDPYYYQWGSVTATVAYLVEYEDGDVEQMPAEEVIKHHNAWLVFAQSAPSTAC